jgi:hypothetical protein
MVVPARGKEYGVCPVLLRHLEPQNYPIERERAIDVLNLQVHVPNPYAGIDLGIVHAWLLRHT